MPGMTNDVRRGGHLELPSYRGWSNSKGRFIGREGTNTKRNFPKYPVIHAKLLSDDDDDNPSRNITVKSETSVVTKPKLKLIFQPPLDSDKKLLSKTENPQRTERRDTKLKLIFEPPLDDKLLTKTENPRRTGKHDTKLKLIFQPPLDSDEKLSTKNENPQRREAPDTKLKVVFQPPLESDKKPLTKTENPQRTEKHIGKSSKKEIQREPVVAGQFDDVDTDEEKFRFPQNYIKTSPEKENQRVPLIVGKFDDDFDTDSENVFKPGDFDNTSIDSNNNVQSSGIDVKFEDLSLTEPSRTEDERSSDSVLSIEELLSTVGQTLPDNVQLYPVSRLRDLCRGQLAAGLVALLNTCDGGALLVGVDEDLAAPGLRLTRGERDRVRQLLDCVCLDNIHPTVTARQVNIEFIPVNTETFKDTFVIKITVTIKEIMEKCHFALEFRLRGLKMKGYDHGLYKMSGRYQFNNISDSLKVCD